MIVASADRLPLPDQSVDLVFGSPPYCDARTYGISAQRKCQEWIDWMLAVTAEAVRVSRGLVLWVCAGVTRDHVYWPACEGLLYEWWKRGGHCWRPAYWHRSSIPGSGGKQWLRSDIEYVLALKRPGPLPWSNPLAMGSPCKHAGGGLMSSRKMDGQRKNRNQYGGTRHNHGSERGANGERKHANRPNHDYTGEARPAIANPGNLIHVPVGGGLMGSALAHENEAPFPEKLAKFFIESFCPPRGIVLDPFCGSGTTLAAAMLVNRRCAGSDLRHSQAILTNKRIAETVYRLGLFAGAA